MKRVIDGKRGPYSPASSPMAIGSDPGPHWTADVDAYRTRSSNLRNRALAYRRARIARISRLGRTIGLPPYSGGIYGNARVAMERGEFFGWGALLVTPEARSVMRNIIRLERDIYRADRLVSSILHRSMPGRVIV